MLKSERLQELSNYFISLYEQLEDFIIGDFSRRVSKAGTVTDMAEWQIIRAELFGMSEKALKKKISSVLNITLKEVDKLFEEIALESISADSALYEYAKLTPLHLSQSEELRDYINAVKEQTKSEFKNITGSLGFCTTINGIRRNKKLTDAYRQALDLAQLQISSGAVDYKTAIKIAIKTISKEGVKVVKYDTDWVNRLDVAVRRATLTGVSQVSQKINNKVIDDLGTDIVEVTAHAGARSVGAGIKNHKAWQGKWYSLSGKSKEYPSLKRVTGLGHGDGLGGWNCTHQYFAVIPGASTPTYTREQLENIDPPSFGYKGRTYTHYQALQQQRKIETAIRQTKREIIAYKNAGLEEDFTSASIKLNRQKQEYKNFSRVAGLLKRNERHQVQDFDKSISQKSAWSNKKNK
ncbi:TPA: phage minor capsid protein [Clostridioides difficile]|nr:phage minor capsid protein [Clostridioides difficile]HCQ6084429.1 phage minor capsid protein [Clostridioides difficile]